MERCSDVWAHLLAADVAVLMEAARPILSEELAAVLDGLAEDYSKAVMAPHLVHSEIVRLAGSGRCSLSITLWFSCQRGQNPLLSTGLTLGATPLSR
ncbi:MAG: hypothetical protein Ct9H300mP31_19390 [Acidimicrobiaceae bacterium]|nr:MAG: hypothetical protein Ct9H300mP31_19390 [Acidimicrobiaceae bacterium]